MRQLSHSHQKGPVLCAPPLLVPSLPDVVMFEKLVVSLSTLGLLPFVLPLLFSPSDASFFFFAFYSFAIFCFLCGTWWTSALMATNLTASSRLVVLLICNFLLLLSLALLFLLFTMSHTFPLLALGFLFPFLALGERYFGVFSQQPKYYASTRFYVSSAVLVLHFVAWFKFSPNPLG